MVLSMKAVVVGVAGAVLMAVMGAALRVVDAASAPRSAVFRFGHNDSLGVVSETGKLTALPGGLDDTYFNGLDVDGENNRLFWTARDSIWVATTKGKWKEQIIGGLVNVIVDGFNLDDTSSIVVKGYTCTSVTAVSENQATCVLHQPDLLSSEYADDNVAVLSPRGMAKGPHSFPETRLAAGVTKPVISAVRFEDVPFQAHAIVVNRESSSTSSSTEGRIYWSNNAASCIQSAEHDGSEVRNISTNTNRVYGLAIDVSSDSLFYTDANRGVVSRIPLDPESTLEASDSAEGTANETILGQNLEQPRAVVVDPDSLSIFVSLGLAGKVVALRYPDDGTSFTLTETPTTIAQTAYYTSRADGLAILPADPTASSVWTDGRLLFVDTTEHSVMQTTSGGAETHQLFYGEGDQALIWPRAMSVYEEPNSTWVYVSEFLGRIWRQDVSTTRGTPELLVDKSDFSVADTLLAQVRDLRIVGQLELLMLEIES